MTLYTYAEEIRRVTRNGETELENRRKADEFHAWYRAKLSLEHGPFSRLAAYVSSVSGMDIQVSADGQSISAGHITWSASKFLSHRGSFDTPKTDALFAMCDEGAIELGSAEQ
jgi:hypothetical protein